MVKKLRRSSFDSKIAGVCGGIAEYFDLDSSKIRLAWIITILFAGCGLFLYIVLALILPKE